MMGLVTKRQRPRGVNGHRDALQSDRAGVLWRQMAWCSVFGPPSGVELHFVKKIEYLCTQSKHSDEMLNVDQPISATAWRWGFVGGRQAIIAPGSFPWRSSSLHPTPPRISGFHSSPVASTTKQQLPVLRPPSSPRHRPTRQEEPGAHPTLSRQFPPEAMASPKAIVSSFVEGAPPGEVSIPAQLQRGPSAYEESC